MFFRDETKKKYLLTAIFVTWILILSCNDDLEQQSKEYETIGRIIEVQAETLSIANKITLQSEDEIVEDYFIQTYIEEFSPMHLREHMITGDPVKVFYKISDNKNVINHIEDFDE
jgi:hypothetical protein